MSSTQAFSPDEWSFLSTLLALVAEQFSYKSCSDYPLDATAENKALAAAVIERAGLSGDWGDEDASWEDYVADVMAQEDQIVTFMDWVAAHLAARCRQLADGTGQIMTGAEQAAMADLLGVALDDHDEAEAIGIVPYAIDMDADNRAVLAHVSPEATRAPEQAASVPLKAVLIHFAQRAAAA